MDALIHDLRYALRRLISSPGFTLTAVLTLALGIGANSTIFSVVNALLLRPPALVRAPERLVTVFTSDYSGPKFGGSSYADYRDFATRATTLESLAAYAPRPFALSTGSETQRAFGEIVSGNYFGTLGVQAQVGRALLPDDDALGSQAPVAVISDGLWRSRFGGEGSVLGREIKLAGTSYTIVGVAPAGFSGSIRGLGIDIWIPMASPRGMVTSPAALTARGDRGLFLVGRMRAGATLSQVQSQLDVIARQLHASFPEMWTDVRAQPRAVTVLAEAQSRVLPQARGMVLTFASLLMTVVGLVLLICCANVANLLLARATGRQREVAIRLAIGASRGRLVRQLLTESVLLALLGGGAAMLLATWATAFLEAFHPPLPVRIAIDLSVDAHVLVFTLVIALLASVAFGLAPALRATRPDLVPALKEETPTVGRRRRFGLRNVLVVAQVAVSLVLLITAGLFLRSLRNAQTVNPGFNASHIALVGAELSTQGYPDERARTFWAALEERVRGLPGVQATALAESAPLGMDFSRRGVQVEGYQRRPGEDMEFGANGVGPGYFRMMQIPLVLGREFGAEDRAGAAPVVIVNETFAHRFWPTRSALGQRVSTGEGMATVIGVARDAKYRSLGEDPQPFFYTPYLQRPASDMTLQVRTAGDPEALLPALRREARALDADLPVRALTMDEHLGVALLPNRVLATLLGIFGALGLALAGIGLYGTVAYAVSQRTRELGIRVALGATGADVRRLVVREGMSLTAVGLGVGLAIALAATRLASSLLFGIGATDPLTFVTVSLFLAAIAGVASYLPARRVTRLDPLVALRSE